MTVPAQARGQPGAVVLLAVYYTPAIISYQIMLAGFSSLLIAVSTERERGMLKRLRGTPMPSRVFLAGEIMRTIAVVAVTVAVLVAVGAGVYHVPVQAHTLIGLAVYTVAGTACMCALGLAGTDACATTEAASVAGPFVTLILGFVSGRLPVGAARQLVSRDRAGGPAVAAGQVSPGRSGTAG